MDDKLYKVEVKYTDNADKFRPAAIAFEKTGQYTPAPKGTKEYRTYWEEQIARSMHGYTTEDGDYITGYFYFYLNFCQIIVSKEYKYKDARGYNRTKTRRTKSFPFFYDYDRAYFDAVEEAENQGKHLVVLKRRQAGYSYKNASMLCRNFYCIPDSKSMAVASEMEFLTKDGILTKAWEMMDFIDQNTAMSKKRQKLDTRTHKRASIVKDVDGVKTEIGYKSEILGVSMKNDPQKMRGKNVKLMLYEEGGHFPNVITTWQIARPSVEDDDGFAYGLMILFGCVVEGTKVFTNDGRLIKIEDLKQADGIVGYNTYSAEQQSISHFREPYETECYRITSHSGKELECSHDHPIIHSTAGMSKRVPGKRKENLHMKTWGWKKAEEFKIGDQIGVIEEVPFFGTKEIWEPRVVGWLVGDGSYGGKKTPVLSNCEDEINAYIETHLDTALEKDYITKEGKHYKETRIRGIRPILKELGIAGQSKEKKTLPKDIFECSKQNVCEFLGGFFDADGYITDPTNSGNYIINLSSAYKSLLLEVSELLLKIGVHGKIQYVKPSEKNPIDRNGYYRLSICDVRSLHAFINNITFFPHEKIRRAEYYKEFLKTKHSEISPYIHGMRFERVVSIEPIGKKKVYNITADDNNTYIANGFITHNTGSTGESDFAGLKDIFYNPRGYNALEIENEWDEGVADKACGFFVPQYYNMNGQDKDGHPFMDKNGNSNVSFAKEFSLIEREKLIKHSSDRSAIDRYIIERPFSPQEACLSVTSNIFPKKELMNHLADIRNSKALSEYKQVGVLDWNKDGSLRWELDPRARDIIKYRLDPADSKEGAIVVWEHPVEDPPYALYVAGCDPYDHDKSSTGSLGSCFIYKRIQSFEKFYDLPVAEYTGRPDTANEFYENVRKLVKYYGATLLYENEKKGLFTYFEHTHSEHLLADQPGTIKDIIKDTKVQRGKGIHMNKEIKIWMEGLIKDYLIEEFSPGQKNLLKIYSEPLLEELIDYNDDGNFDRVIAFGLCMIYREELFQVQVKKKKEDGYNKMLIPNPLFTHNNF